MTSVLKPERVIQSIAVYDLLVTSVLAFPPLVRPIFQLIAQLDSQLGLGTQFSELDQTTVFVVNLAAASVVAWALLRLQQPGLAALRIDLGYRVILIAVQLIAVAQGATPLILCISTALIAIALLEIYLLNHMKAQPVPW